jgi:hypothetical protein
MQVQQETMFLQIANLVAKQHAFLVSDVPCGIAMLRTLERAFGMPSEHQLLCFRSVGYAPRGLVEAQFRVRKTAVLNAIGFDIERSEIAPVADIVLSSAGLGLNALMATIPTARKCSEAIRRRAGADTPNSHRYKVDPMTNADLEFVPGSCVPPE